MLDLLNALTGSATGVVSGHTGSSLNDIAGINTPVGSYIANGARDNASCSTRPRAFINYIFLNEQLRMMGGSFSAVNNTAGMKTHFSELQNLLAPANGYVYIYASNESPVDVFFDNLQVTHVRGPMLEESHYYPFGLTMAGISSKALEFGGPENKYKFNGIEQNNDFGLNMYDAHYRNLDPQPGRFWQIDPKPNENFSPYAAMANNPILYSDPLGDTVINGQKFEAANAAAATTLENVTVKSNVIKAGYTITPCSTCHISNEDIKENFNKDWVAAMAKLNRQNGQVLPPQPFFIDWIAGHREIPDPDYDLTDLGSVMRNLSGVLVVVADGYIIGPGEQYIYGIAPGPGRSASSITSMVRRL